MARTWLRIRVDLDGGGGNRCDPAPGRVFIVGPGHTFEQFAAATDSAFARWDLSYLHEFELADGRKIGYPDDECAPELVWLDHAKLNVTREVKPGDEFSYAFDFGDGWEHRCLVEPTKADPVDEYKSCRPWTDICCLPLDPAVAFCFLPLNWSRTGTEFTRGSPG